ncbi:MAG: hypothetical protein ACKVW3_00690 [Phycisphaerales bacterium]
MLRRAVVIDTLIDESHFIVSTRCCRHCGRMYLWIFTEQVDWADSDDPQAWMCVPLELPEIDLLRTQARSAPVDEAFLLGLGIRRRMLTRRCPKGAPETIAWAVRDLCILPHD